MDANIVCLGDSWRVCMCFCSPEYYYDQEERTDEEAEPTFSEDEAVSQKGLRRSQSVKLSRSRVRKDVSVLFHWVRTLVCRYILLPQSVVLNLWTAAHWWVFFLNVVTRLVTDHWRLKARRDQRWAPLTTESEDITAVTYIHTAEQAAGWWMVLSACF